MCYLRFDKTQMTNLQDSLFKELLITNRSGAYCSTTLVGCNIRKYHGLLVVPVPEIDDENHVLLSSLDETVIQHGAEFNLGLHKYQGENYSPKGHKYIVSFEWEKVPTWVYRIGGVLLKKEIAYDTTTFRLYIRYTLLDAHSATTLRLKPFLAFRSVRQWTHENGAANTGFEAVENGIRMCLYQGYPDLYMQLNHKAEWHHQPDWYRGLDYPKERERGYDSSEDLMVPGYFEMPIKKGESIIFTASLASVAPRQMGKLMDAEIAALDSRDSFYHCLVNAAHQFKVQKDGENYLLAGYPWFKCRARDMFIAMPGITLSIGEVEMYEKYMETAAKAIRSYINKEPLPVAIYEMEQPDTLLWAIWCIQQYGKYVSRQKCNELYGDLLREMIKFIRDGKHSNLFLHDNGLLYSNGRDRAVTWMNAQSNGRPITPRSGYIVEFNALWYNALKFYEQILSENGGEENKALAAQFAAEAEKTARSFKEVFLNEYGYLLDYVDGQMMDWSVRPNQLFAIALDFSPLDMKERKSVLDICTKELVTPKGIRSLSPKSGGYNPMYIGRQEQRDFAYHQGTAWPWLTGFYLEAYLRVYRMSGVNYIERQLIGFEEELFYHCVGTIPELFDGNPRFSGRGAISFAMNVSGILRAIRLLEKYNNELA
ncbi:MAG: glycogen debranching enzyme N-terminal domain-containing protein [Bacteroidales bacterium]|nr:amylo-alpha-1,6-glucosidase [Bacteroidales bacterium]MDY4663666.1 amylo-alpha-1,6-glucosidase [Alloprevotella sp.]